MRSPTIGGVISPTDSGTLNTPAAAASVASVAALPPVFFVGAAALEPIAAAFCRSISGWYSSSLPPVHVGSSSLPLSHRSRINW